MVTKKNLMEIVQKLMVNVNESQMGNKYRDELIAKLIDICSQNDYQFIANFEWYSTTFIYNFCSNFLNLYLISGILQFWLSYPVLRAGQNTEGSSLNSYSMSPFGSKPFDRLSPDIWSDFEFLFEFLTFISIEGNIIGKLSPLFKSIFCL